MSQKKNSSSKQPVHADHTSVMPRLKRAQGQVNAVARMIEEKEYCPNIIQQLRAATSALKSLEAVILERHLDHCVQDAMNSKNENISKKKIAELIKLFKKGN